MTVTNTVDTMRNKIRELDSAYNKVEDSISLVRLANNKLCQIGSTLHRIRENCLRLQLSEADIYSNICLQELINTNMKDIEMLMSESKFNDMKLFTSTASFEFIGGISGNISNKKSGSVIKRKRGSSAKSNEVAIKIGDNLDWNDQFTLKLNEFIRIDFIDELNVKHTVCFIAGVHIPVCYGGILTINFGEKVHKYLKTNYSNLNSEYKKFYQCFEILSFYKNSKYICLKSKEKFENAKIIEVYTSNKSSIIKSEEICKYQPSILSEIKYVFDEKFQVRDGALIKINEIVYELDEDGIILNGHRPIIITHDTSLKDMLTSIEISHSAMNTNVIVKSKENTLFLQGEEINQMLQISVDSAPTNRSYIDVKVYDYLLENEKLTISDKCYDVSAGSTSISLFIDAICSNPPKGFSITKCGNDTFRLYGNYGTSIEELENLFEYNIDHNKLVVQTSAKGFSNLDRLIGNITTEDFGIEEIYTLTSQGVTEAICMCNIVQEKIYKKVKRLQSYEQRLLEVIKAMDAIAQTIQYTNSYQKTIEVSREEIRKEIKESMLANYNQLNNNVLTLLK